MDRPWLRSLTFASAAWCLAGFAFWWEQGIFEDLRWPGGLVGAIFALAALWMLIHVVRLLIGRRHGRKLLVWFRRFGNPAVPSGQLNRWHGRILDEASNGLAVPITLQDESIKVSRVAAAAAVMAYIASMFGSLGSFLWLLELPWFQTASGEMIGEISMFLPLLGAPILLTSRLTDLLGTLTVAPGSVAASARRALRRKRNRRELLILRCQPRHWRACVSELLDVASHAIANADLASGNVHWEIESASERLGARKVLLLQMAEGTEGVERVETDDRNVLRYNRADGLAELTAFTERSRDDRHDEMSPPLPLGPVGTALAREIRTWIRRTEPDPSQPDGIPAGPAH